MFVVGYRVDDSSRQIRLDYKVRAPKAMRGSLMATSTLTPHSFVLADLFDVVSLSLEIPGHVIKSDERLKLVPCPDCKGEG